jgi:hypothetical protein
MQKAKYYIVVVVLEGSFFGANMAGWLDPFSFLYRSFALAVFPGVIAGKDPVLRLNEDAEKCKNCMECVIDWGGAEPQSNETWKPAECPYCWNCHSVCPAKAITFEFKTPEVKS